MRTTVTLDADVAASIRAIMRERGLTFKEALNTVLRAGLQWGAKPRPFKVESRNMGLRPGVDLGGALRLAAALEDEETGRKLELRK
ncbi:MAG: antitoxin [Actinomycetota bacterium]|nr:antitoxin [Actinomycetota bacterium]